MFALLQLEKSRLENALVHLQQSNDQLQEALTQGGPDKACAQDVSWCLWAPVSLTGVRCGQEYEDAVRENVDVMSRYLNRVAELNRELEELRAKENTGVNCALGFCLRSLPGCD